jgi:hypothetical protein
MVEIKSRAKSIIAHYIYIHTRAASEWRKMNAFVPDKVYTRLKNCFRLWHAADKPESGN